MNEVIKAELIFEENMFCVEKLRKLKNLSRDEQIKFTEERVDILWRIADKRKEVGEEIWNLIKTSKTDLLRYYDGLSDETISLCHPVVGKLYMVKYKFFIAFRPRK